MRRLSMNELTTYRWSFEDDALRYKAAGISVMGVWRQKLADYGEQKGAELLNELGMRVSNVQWAGGFTGSEGHSYRESIADALEAIELAADLKSPVLVLYSGGRNCHTHRHAQRLLRGALQELAPVARQRQVTLAVEPMHLDCAADWTFLTTIEETLELIDGVAGGELGVVFDTYHLGRDPAILALLPTFVDRIAVVHLGDGKAPTTGEQNRYPLGAGEVPLAELFAVLTESGYAGDYDVELIGEEIETCDYQWLLRHSQEAYQSLLNGQRLTPSPAESRSL